MAMNSNEVVLDLSAVQFEGKERQLATHGGLSVSVFRFASGIAAVRVRNTVGEIVVLPYHGHQIWDATFHGRRLTMASVFDEPVATGEYVKNYGAFLVHCGANAIGNPAPNDTHPLHGDIPNATFQQAGLILGRDDAGAYVEVTGTATMRAAFSHHYDFQPVVRLRETSGKVELDVTITNHRAKPMELMYMAHVNFRPVDGAVLLDTVPDEAKHFRVRTHLPSYAAGTQAYRHLLTGFQADPASHRKIVAGRAVDPELVAGMDFKAGPDGWAHSMQLLPDGTADIISHRTAELDHGVRWMTRNGDEDALGLFLPATSDADGREAERKKGNVKQLAPGASFKTKVVFGGLTAAEAKDAAAVIAKIRG
ncbi:DUF4432 family protein [Devosia sp.]|uniref:DUF4432 family protein n=1 Tax=Devosia sp. TaxID=1871048 RepID=UPI003BA85677